MKALFFGSRWQCGRTTLLLPVIITVFIVTLEFHTVSCRVAESDLFPYGFGEDEQFLGGDDDFRPYNFTVPFTFFNSTYETVFISPNGQVSFGRGISAFTASCLPSTTPMIMAYWSDVLWTIDRVRSKILFRETADRNLLNKAARDIRKAFPEFRDIKLTWMFIVTYKDVPHFGASLCGNSDFKRNTFQLVLTSDGTHSFALIYYSKIEWTTGTASGGSACYGLGGSPAKAGFDYGDGRTLHTIQGSCTSNILNIAETTNIHEPGKWVFRIDSNLRTANCQEFESEGGENKKKLRITPSVVPYMGSVPLEVEGPCISEDKQYTCVFHDIYDNSVLKQDEYGLPSSDFKKVLCPIPRLNRLGRIQVDLEVKPASLGIAAVDSSETEKEVYTGYLYVVSHSVASDNFDFSLRKSKDNPHLIIINATWDPTFFEREARLETFLKRRRRRRKRSIPVMDQTVDLVLESFDGHQWEELGVIQEAMRNSGSHVGPLSHEAKQLIKNVMLSQDPQWVSVHLRRSEQEGTVNWSKLVPNMLNTIKEIFSAFENPFSRFCENWGIAQGPVPEDTLPCPPTQELAVADRNFQKDAAGRMMPFWHPGGVYAVRQRVPSPSNAGSQCVYGDDGRLMVGPMGGGTLDLYSPSYDIPLHLLHDVLPYLICCRLSGPKNRENCANIYYRHRPSDDGTKYIRPRPTRAVGDPHIITFDGLQYTFNGVGEFTMVHMEEPNCTFEMQARMEQYVNPQGTPMNASVYTAAVMKEVINGVNVTTIQVSYSNGGLLLLLDGESPDFDENTPWDFSMTYRTAYLTFNSPRNVAVSFSSGFSFEFDAPRGNEMVMNIIGMTSSSKRTKGLLGNNDGASDNDFECPDGRILESATMTPETIHEFGMKWIVSEESTIFSYSPGKSHGDYIKLAFQPKFLSETDIQSMPGEILESCGHSPECVYDLITTGSLELANDTKISTQEFKEVQEIISKPVQMCPSVSSPKNGFTQITNLFVGGEVKFSCIEGYEIRKGPSNCTCISDRGGSLKWRCLPDNKPIEQAECVDINSVEECDPPPILKHGTVIGTNYSVGSSVWLRCDGGRNMFWSLCHFDGPEGICKEPTCRARLTCELKETDGATEGKQREAVWVDLIGSPSKFRCLNKLQGVVAEILRRTTIAVHEATQQKMLPDFVKANPHLLGC